MSKSPHIVWPAVIIAFLLFSGVASFGILYFSQSDGGVQVVDDYYRKSVEWDAAAAAQRASDGLGWVARIDLQAADALPATGTATFLDAEGVAIEGLTGSVTVSRPQSSVTYGTHSLTPHAALAGEYTFSFPYVERGLWDLDVVAQRDSQRYSKRIRIEI